MVQVNLCAELGKSECVASRVVLGHFSLVDQVVYEFFVRNSVVRLKEGFQTFHSSEKNGLLWVFYIFLNEFLSKLLNTLNTEMSSCSRGTLQMAKL
jgi:hypothetical protein